jgi:hypothetical protein
VHYPGGRETARGGEISTVIRSGPPRSAATRAVVYPSSSLTKGDTDGLDPSSLRIEVILPPAPAIINKAAACQAARFVRVCDSPGIPMLVIVDVQ